jgi:hypothetical protein
VDNGLVISLHMFTLRTKLSVISSFPSPQSAGLFDSEATVFVSSVSGYLYPGC